MPALPRLLAALLCIAALPAGAAPAVPASEGEILLRLPPASRLLAAVRARVAPAPARLDPGRADDALELAQAYLDAGRASGEARFVSYALTVLEPALAQRETDVRVLVLAATAEQYLHRFDPALALLERALAASPRHPQALLTKAALLEVRGELPAAQRACRRLAGVADTLVAVTCLSSVTSRSGQLADSRRALQSLHDAAPHPLPADVDAWVSLVLADMADRAGDDVAMRTHLAHARAVAPQDPKVLAAQADLLLRDGRPAEVIALLADAPQSDALLLRLTLATHAAGRADDAQAKRSAARFVDGAPAGETAHLREQARYLLEVRGDPEAALRAALGNWQRQREPEDVRLLLAAAAAARRPQAAQSVRHWIVVHRYEDARLR